MSSEGTFGGPSGANNSTIEYAETAVVNGVNAKKVFVIDADGNLFDGVPTVFRKILNLLRSLGNVDVAQRQIVKIGALGGVSGGVEVTTTIPISGSVTATVASTTVTAVGTFDPRFQFYDLARVKYATGMRNNLSFT
jgi:hypothetical protein